jgi:thiol-disulfide isomerase/thioredoxin
MFAFARSTCALILLVLAAPFLGYAAEIGDPAAPLAIASWVKGDAVEVGQGDKVYVIEFWATWCPPCHESIPHLTALQGEYEGELVIVGITDEDPATVQHFLEQMGDKMDYTVAIDAGRASYDGYMGAYGQTGIPAAFILDRQGRVTWVGNPLVQEFDDVIGRVVAGSYDGAAARKDAELLKVREELYQEFVTYCGAGDLENANALADKILKEHSTGADLLTGVAWAYLYSKNEAARNPERAVEFAAAAAKVTEGKNFIVLDVYARALSESGDLAGAIREQRRALERAPESVRPKVQEQLDKYMAAQSTQTEPAA